jgi:hypothetical protein
VIGYLFAGMCAAFALLLGGVAASAPSPRNRKDALQLAATFGAIAAVVACVTTAVIA